MNLIVNVNNLPAYVEQYDWLVARAVDGVLWFWSAYNDEQTARISAREVDGIVVKIEKGV